MTGAFWMSSVCIYIYIDGIKLCKLLHCIETRSHVIMCYRYRIFVYLYLLFSFFFLSLIKKLSIEEIERFDVTAPSQATVNFRISLRRIKSKRGIRIWRDYYVDKIKQKERE